VQDITTKAIINRGTFYIHQTEKDGKKSRRNHVWID